MEMAGGLCSFHPQVAAFWTFHSATCARLGPQHTSQSNHITSRRVAPLRARARRIKNFRRVVNRRHPADSLVDARAETSFQMETYLTRSNKIRYHY